MSRASVRSSSSSLVFLRADFFGYAELNQLTGIAAILTYPLDIEDVEEEERLNALDAAEKLRKVLAEREEPE